MDALPENEVRISEKRIRFAKYCLQLPLNRQSTTYAREGIELDVSTLVDWVGACAATLTPVVAARAHEFAVTSIRRLGSPMCSPGCMITPQSGSTSSCHGISVRHPGLPMLPDSFTPG
jgi:hypothetical protein